MGGSEGARRALWASLFAGVGRRNRGDLPWESALKKTLASAGSPRGPHRRSRRPTAREAGKEECPHSGREQAWAARNGNRTITPSEPQPSPSSRLTDPGGLQGIVVLPEKTYSAATGAKL